MPEPPTLEYRVGTPPEWDAGSSKFGINLETLELYGPCPRCTHTLSKDISPYVLAPAFGAGQPEHATVRVVCNCQEPHNGRPEKQKGCGAEGTLEVDL